MENRAHFSAFIFCPFMNFEIMVPKPMKNKSISVDYETDNLETA